MPNKRKKDVMSKGRYSEEEAVQKPAGELLRKMGWELVYAYNDEGSASTAPSAARATKRLCFVGTSWTPSLS